MKTKNNNGAARDAGRQMKFHPARMVRTWKMFTVDGRPVYCLGWKGFTLEKAANRNQCTTYEDDGKEFAPKRQAKATEAIGVSVEWREVEPTEMMGVSF